MFLGLVSDTHGHVEFTRAAVRVLESFDLARVVHCGDIGSTAVVELFARWPTDFVFGNVDENEAELRRAISSAGLECQERFGKLELAGRRIAFLHGDDNRLLWDTISGGSYDLVCHGHTHVLAKQMHGQTLVVNPGAVFRANPRSVAILQLPELEVTHIPLP